MRPDRVDCTGYRKRKQSIVRQLALAKLRELREDGMSFLEIRRHLREMRAAVLSDSAETVSRSQRTSLVGGPPSQSEGAPVHDDRVAFFRALDALEQGLAFFSTDGVPLFTNEALARMAHGASGGEWLYEEIHQFANSLCGLVRLRRMEEEVAELAVREIPQRGNRYQLRGSYIGLDLFGRGSCVLITLDRPVLNPLSDEVLKDRFGLSRQKSRILRLLLAGKTNPEIAESLIISRHTVRHHVEQIFRHLDVHSRAELAARILGMPDDPEVGDGGSERRAEK